MATLDVLTYGFALNTDQGSFGYSTNSLLRVGSHNILIDTGPSSRRPFLYRALTNYGLTTDDIDIVILTHMHWDHCQNTDLFRNARVLVNPTEIDYARNPNQWDLAVAAGMADMMRNMNVEPVSEGDVIVEGVSVLETPGHTKGHMSVLAEVDGEKVLLAGDAMPESGTVARGMPYNIFWDLEDAKESVEKMVSSSNVFYPGHDRPFRVQDDKILYLHGPDNIHVMDSTEGGGTASLTFTVHAERSVNIDIVQK
jgi:glyoxylase-like metal-dependent hydrolase (beta-lactamase superfamily II)